MSRVRVIALSVVIAVSLAGCVAGSPEPVPGETVAEPSSTPSAELTKPELSDLVLSADGLGPLLLGAAPPVTSPELDVLVFDEDYCDVNATPGLQHDEPGLWITNYPDAVDNFDNAYPGSPFRVGVWDGVVARIDVYSQEPATAEGIHVGSTLEEVLAAYPNGFDSTVEEPGSDIYVLNGATGHLIIEVTNDEIEGYWDADKVDRVYSIAAWGLELEPRGVAGSDNSVGHCIEY